LKLRLRAAELPVLPSASHIVPVHIGDAALCSAVSRRLLDGSSVCMRRRSTIPRSRAARRLRLDADTAAYRCHDGSAGDGAAGILQSGQRARPDDHCLRSAGQCGADADALAAPFAERHRNSAHAVHASCCAYSTLSLLRANA
jgi:hypothetical protein